MRESRKMSPWWIAPRAWRSCGAEERCRRGAGLRRRWTGIGHCGARTRRRWAGRENFQRERSKTAQGKISGACRQASPSTTLSARPSAAESTAQPVFARAPSSNLENTNKDLLFTPHKIKSFLRINNNLAAPLFYNTQETRGEKEERATATELFLSSDSSCDNPASAPPYISATPNPQKRHLLNFFLPISEVSGSDPTQTWASKQVWCGGGVRPLDKASGRHWRQKATRKADAERYACALARAALERMMRYTSCGTGGGARGWGMDGRGARGAQRHARNRPPKCRAEKTNTGAAARWRGERPITGGLSLSRAAQNLSGGKISPWLYLWIG